MGTQREDGSLNVYGNNYTLTKGSMREDGSLNVYLINADDFASGGGDVSSVFSRTGDVVAVSGDYTASLITNTSSVSGTTVKDALETLSASVGGGGAVTSVFTRTGAVVAASGDYTFAQIGSTPTTLAGYGITDAQPLSAQLTYLATASAATAAAYRTLLGLVIGTDVEAHDATLTALAAYNTNGLLTQTGADTFTGRTITGTLNRLSVSNGSGVSGNPTLDIDSAYVGQNTITTLGTITTGVWTGTNIAVANGGTGSGTAAGARTNLGLVIGTDVEAHDATLTALAAYSTDGILTHTGVDTFAGRTITGTTNRLSVSNGDGVAGNPTLDIDSGYVGQSSITTLGTITTGTWSATTVAVNKGGTGQTSYTDGQLLIGNTTGNTLAKGTLTAPAAGITITGGSGSITFALANDLSGLEGLSSNGMAARTGTSTWSTRTIAGTGLVTVTNGDGVSGAPSIAVTAAVQSDQETGSSTSVAVVPGVQQYHPSAAKCWGVVTVSGGTPTLQTSYNITSISDDGVGVLGVTIATDFSTANYALVSTTLGGTARSTNVINSTVAAGTFQLDCWTSTSGAANDPQGYQFVGFGDQ